MHTRLVLKVDSVYLFRVYILQVLSRLDVCVCALVCNTDLFARRLDVDLFQIDIPRTHDCVLKLVIFIV